MHDINKFEYLLDYEIRCSTRYRRFMSLVICEKNQCIKDEQKSKIKKHLRTCDTVFHFDQAVIILMPETDQKGASKAIGRIKSELGFNGANISFASFPLDGNTGDSLLNTAVKRLST